MSTKLFVYKFNFFEGDSSQFSFYALADNEYEAKALIIDKVENETYKKELIKSFEENRVEPKIYEKNEVLIQHQGELPVFFE